MIDLYEKGKAKFDWWPDWRGECVAIIAGGPSAQKAGVEKLKNRIHVVAINESYRLCPWAEFLYSCDASWWDLRRLDIEKSKFKGTKITWEVYPQIQDMKLKKIDIERDADQNFICDFRFKAPGLVGSGGNSCFQITNLVAQFGATGIAFVGLDLRLDKGRHWHGEHPQPLRNPDQIRIVEWRRWFERSAPRLRKNGIDVVNCSLDSALGCFPKMTIDQMLERWSL